MNHTVIREQDEYYCPKCGCRWSVNDLAPPVCVPGPVTREEINLIGFLAAKLACYEPDNVTVKRALEYLKCHM